MSFASRIKAATLDTKSTSFGDSSDATDFMYTLSSGLNSKALENWAAITDRNYDTKTLAALKKARKSYSAFLEAMESAE